MSYLRFGSELKYAIAKDGSKKSENYIYEDVGGFIQDYGEIEDSSLLELCCRAINEYYDKYKLVEDDNLMFKKYLMTKLAKRLEVKLQKEHEYHKESKTEYAKKIKELQQHLDDVTQLLNNKKGEPNK